MDDLSEIEEASKSVSEDLLPAKSKKLYQTAYTNFLNWQKKNKKINSFTEDTLLMYFDHLSLKYKSSSLWAIYSMLKSMINLNNGISLESYIELRDFLKRCSEGYQARKAEVFTGEQIDQFIKKATDDIYLATKVVAIMGIVGACRACELRSLKTQDVTFFEASLIVTLPETSRNISRRFTIFGNFVKIVKKYASLRPTNTTIDNFFIKYYNGRCYAYPMGINKFATMGKVIATYLDLPNPSKYTGFCFRRSSANLHVDGGGNIVSSKRRNRKSNMDLSEYSVDNAKKAKVDTVETLYIENSSSPSGNSSNLNDVHDETNDFLVLDIDPLNLNDSSDNISDSTVLKSTFTVNKSVNNSPVLLKTEKADLAHERWNSGSALEGFQTQPVKPLARVTVREEDVVRLALEFLHNRNLHISQLGLERETGVINGNYSDNVLFLRQLILDGQWEDVLHFIQQLEEIESFEMRKFTYTILKYKYIELLWIKSEAKFPENSVDINIEEVEKVLEELEIYSPTKQDYLNLSLLSTLPNLTDHSEYKDWNPSNARVQCFQEVYPLVVDFLPNDECKTTESTNANNQTGQNDRLIQLIIKGLLYESCVNYCQSNAIDNTNNKTGGVETTHQTGMHFSGLLDGSVGFNNSDSCLLSWLQSVPSETFIVPFEQKTLTVEVERLERPFLETVWTEHLIATPIKPKKFPHSVTPFKRICSAAHIVARNLMPRGCGNAEGGRISSLNLGGYSDSRVIAMDNADIDTNGLETCGTFDTIEIKSSKSVDELIENECEVFPSNNYGEFQQFPSNHEKTINTLKEIGRIIITKSKRPIRKVLNASTLKQKEDELERQNVETKPSYEQCLDKSTQSKTLNQEVKDALSAGGANTFYQQPCDPGNTLRFGHELRKASTKLESKLGNNNFFYPSR